MNRVVLYAAAALVIIHGLIHLMGFVAYWPLGEIAELPYKTSLLGGRWEVGKPGMRLFSLLWPIVAVGFVIAATGLATRQAWWYPLMWGMAILSLIITGLDWSNAFRGANIDLVIIIVLFLVLGLRIQPKPFAAYPEQALQFEYLPVPTDLPAPVDRFYRVIAGEQVPLIDSAVITARGTLRFMGITFPARMRFTHDAGQGYRHYIEATYFGYPLMKVNEFYFDGNARMELPFGVVENEPKNDMSANLGLWGESMWLPSIFLTDSRVRWEAIEDTTAQLVVPFGAEEDTFIVNCDPETGLIHTMEAMRYKEATAEEKIPWLLEPLAWEMFHGVLIPSQSTATWEDEGSPWLAMTLEEVVYNVDISTYIRASGP